jgi:hypothetical protein
MRDDNAKSGGSWGTALFGLGILAAVAGWWYFSLGWADDVGKGPTPITAEELLAMGEGKDPPSRWVTYTATGDFVPTDIRVMKNVTQEVAKFVLVPVGKRFLIAEVEPDFKGRTYAGKLEVWGGGGPQSDAVAEIRKLVGHQSGRLLQFQLDTRTSPANQLTAQYALQGIAAAFGVMCCLAGLCGRKMFDVNGQ